MPPSTMTSASETLAQVTPIAPKSIWRRAIQGDLWPLEWGRQFLPPAAMARRQPVDVGLEPARGRAAGTACRARPSVGRCVDRWRRRRWSWPRVSPADVTAPGPCDPASAIVDCRQSPHMETTMEVVASGAFWDARTAPVNERSASSTSAVALADGSVLATCRLGTDREGADGHVGVFASADGGESWELRFLGLGERVWDGWPGEARGWYVAELEPGELIASVLWTDRSDPSHPWVHPVTQGLLGMRSYLIRSTDGGRSWPDRRRIDLGPHPGASVTGPVLRLADGTLAQPFENWKEYEDPTPGIPCAWLRLSPDDGATWTEDVLVAAHPDNAIYYWDQRLATHPVDGRLVNMFWTHVPADGRDIDVHICLGHARRPDLDRAGRDRACPASTASRSRSVATGCWRSTRIASSPAGIHAPRSARTSAGRGTSMASSWSGPARPATSPGPGRRGRRRSTGTTWAPGSSGTRAARCCRTARCWSCSTAGRGARAAAAGRGSAGVTRPAPA